MVSLPLRRPARPSRAAIAAYVSGHGFGHLTRSEAVLRRVAAAGVDVHLRTSDKALTLAKSARWAASVRAIDTGPGVAQKGPIAIDLDATIAALQAHLAGFDALADAEAEALRALEVGLVYADIPPIAFEAAHRASVPSIGLSNFSWSWIYEGYEAARPAFAPITKRLAEAEGHATLLLSLPFSCPFESFARREPIALVVRPFTQGREQARACLPIRQGDTRPLVLLSFGGFGDELSLDEAVAKCPDLLFVGFREPARPIENLLVLPQDHGLPHQDLVLAADVLLGKPGYGTVAEAIAAKRAFVHTPRGDFRELPLLVRAIEENLPQASLTLDDFLAGRWQSALRDALTQPAAETKVAMDGATEAAARILRAIGLEDAEQQG